MGTTLKNIAFLDLTEATDETLEGIDAIKKVAFMLYNEKFESHMKHIAMQGIASSVKVSGKYTIINGKQEMDQSIVSDIKEALFYLINGKLVIKPDVTSELIEQAISGMAINGKVLCPESLQSALQQKINQINGKLVTYIDHAILVDERLTINNDYLHLLKPHSSLAVTGDVHIADDVDLKLLEEKLDRVQFLNSVVMPEIFQKVLSEKLVNTPKITVIPQGYTYIDRDFEMDADEIARYKKAKLFVAGSIYFQKDVTVALIQKHVEDLRTDGAVYCPSDLREVVAEVCPLSTKLISYNGSLRVISDHHKLSQAELKYTDNKLTLVIHGVLELDQKLDPELLFDKVERVDLYGVITGTSEQCGVINTKVKIKEGVVEDTEDEEAADEDIESDQSSISNVSYLKL